MAAMVLNSISTNLHRIPSEAASRLLGSGSARKDASQAQVHIELDQHWMSKIYTTGSTVQGRVVIRPGGQDVVFDELAICLVGASTTQTYTQQECGVVATPFLKLVMPLAPDPVLKEGVFRAGQQHVFPFSFVLPSSLAADGGVCRHTWAAPGVEEQHLRPPPSMGSWPIDDQAPQTAQIKYLVSAVATRHVPSHYRPLHVLEASHTIRVLPAFAEDAPLDVFPPANHQRYVLARTRTLRKAYVASKLGRLTATTTQPRAIMLSPDARAASQTTCRLELAFDVTGPDVPPPTIFRLTAKLTAHTFFSLALMNRLPDRGVDGTFQVAAPFEYTTSVGVFTLPMDSLRWTSQDGKEEDDNHDDWSRQKTLCSSSVFHADEKVAAGTVSSRRSSAATSCPELLGTSRRLVSDVEIRFGLPDLGAVMYLPSFHSCRISRTYTLDLSLSVGQTLTPLTLTVPLQIGVEPTLPS